MEFFQAVDNQHYQRVSQARRQLGLPTHGLLQSPACAYLRGKRAIVGPDNRMWQLSELCPEWVRNGWAIRGSFIRDDGARMSLLVHNVNCQDDYALYLVDCFVQNYRWVD
ncbi:MAG: hypothetical protein P3W96_006385 [Halomonas sp.]|nr:hypothetical protein [Halomonas sp.]MDM7481630.1 hypothetical protein [Halomonas sp.]